MSATLPLLVVTTVSDADQARSLARAMVERRLAACAQIHAIESLYRWQGRIAHDPEWRILFKTAADRADALMAAIRAEHPYQMPAIHAVPTVLADSAYAGWVDDETRPAT